MSKPPLWEVMHQAHLEEAGMIRYTTGSQPVLGEPDRFTRAAEIRAVRDWLVPEEDPLPDSVHGGNRYARQSERQRLRALLTTEADRAEKGEVEG